MSICTPRNRREPPIKGDGLCTAFSHSPFTGGLRSRSVSCLHFSPFPSSRRFRHFFFTCCIYFTPTSFHDHQRTFKLCRRMDFYSFEVSSSVSLSLSSFPAHIHRSGFPFSASYPFESFDFVFRVMECQLVLAGRPEMYGSILHHL